MRRGLLVSLWCVMMMIMVSFISLAQKPEDPPPPPQESETQVVEEVVVSATRSEVKKEEVPSSIEVVDTFDIETSVDDNITRILKKNASVDVIDYPGVSSGISIRGFRPEFSGFTKHTLILIDGRPAGAENIASILKGNVQRIEVLKGPASALYGAEAMGGVVNIITKKSKGEIKSEVTVGIGDFKSHYESLSSGGAIMDKLDYDLSFSNKNQEDDFTMGNGKKRENTSYKEMAANLRLGSDVTQSLRLDLKGDWYGGRDIMNPNAIFYLDEKPSEKNIDRLGGDLSLKHTLKNNEITLTGYASHECYDITKQYKGEIHYKSYETETNFQGVQLMNTYHLLSHDLTVGIDFHRVEERSKSYLNSGLRKAPYSPDNSRDNFGLYTDAFLRFMDERLIVNGGVRYDTFELKTEKTPLKTDFTPGSESFDIFNPRIGTKYMIDEGRIFQLHTTIGSAFVPPQAAQMAGYSKKDLSPTETMILKGNPDLDPETSITFDAGITMNHKNMGLYLDLTYFNTKVEDKIITRLISSTATESIRSYANAFEAKMSGIEWELSKELGTFFKTDNTIQFYFNGTYLFEAKEEFEDGKWRDIYNVSALKLNTGITYDDRKLFSKFNCRYMSERKDNDWYAMNYPQIKYDGFTVFDLTMGIHLKKRHTLTLNIENMFHEYYYEKPQYPLPGRAIYLDYSLSF